MTIDDLLSTPTVHRAHTVTRWEEFAVHLHGAWQRFEPEPEEIGDALGSPQGPSGGFGDVATSGQA